MANNSRVSMHAPLDPSDLQLGTTLAAAHFPHLGRRGICRLNNGSFGAAPTHVIAAADGHRTHWCEDPDGFWLHSMSTGLLKSQAALARAFGGSTGDYAVVDNLTVAGTVVARWAERRVIEWLGMPARQKGDPCVLVHTYTYNAVRNGFFAVKDNLRAAGVNLVIVVVETPFPCESAAAIEAAYAAKLCEVSADIESGKIWPVLACLDHVTSLPALVVPIKSLVSRCRTAGFPTFVDGAHAPGYIGGLHVPDVGADMYAANLHKYDS
jgi:selenocysteine lyase/cysteine desulfurase